MTKYVNNSYDSAYKKTMGVNYMEKNIELGTTDIKFLIYDVGGSKEFQNMISLATNDAVALIFTFDLTRKDTLDNVREWYRLARITNQTALPMLVGTKFDKFVELPLEYQEEMHSYTQKFAKAMKSSVVFTSNSDSINVQKVFKILISKAFDLHLTIPEITNVGEPLLIYNITE